MKLDALKEEFVQIQDLLESNSCHLKLQTGRLGKKSSFDFDDIYQLLSDQVNESIIEDQVIQSENIHDEKTLKVLR